MGDTRDGAIDKVREKNNRDYCADVAYAPLQVFRDKDGSAFC